MFLKLRHFFIVSAWLASSGLLQAAEPHPLTRVHAHNDYEHKRPLLDALDNGFSSVEADIHLVEGKLLVAHDGRGIKPERSLEALYLKPLRERVSTHRGHVYENGPDFFLLIDIKGDWRTTYPVLRAELERYADMLTRFEG